MKLDVEDGLYQARSGHLEKLEIEDDGTKKIRVPDECFKAVQGVQKQMRKLLGGRKPDIALVAEAMLMFAANAEGIDQAVKEYCAKVFTE